MVCGYYHLLGALFRSATSTLRSSLLATTAPNTEGSDSEQPDVQFDASRRGSDDNLQGCQAQSSRQTGFQFPFSNLFQNPWSRQQQKQQNFDNQMKSNARFCIVLAFDS